ncbi:alpha/beta hydrolase [Phaeovulum vinaykumarii]|uniref:Palmitoyl-protein thioesterase ABHD10, mitochondrial n=1 Tax=Phaeovulum vinaykumarii TaxID=407234 RepID=A0A1N7JYD5_9RHOB|nr:alpha/beta hydrolase [Phaeovulum vinaykumarii]SIS54337.1 Pimeloyl-ACP methyl ester carboxylesterase [Phaeovulum vinaykumarii]SOB91895.1 pimeloyl-ACP methyl ester carboxylesterase [Phaeovulum vinaykumarii]
MGAEMIERMTTPEGREIAYEALPGTGPGVVFLGGFRSDMEGTKALTMRNRAIAKGRPFLRLDYSGHGQSSGRFVDGAVGDWFADARAVIAACTRGPQVIVGSSMGGWIALLIARSMPERVGGIVTIAAAPDFTEDLMLREFTREERARLVSEGQIERANAYDPQPYVITRRLIEDGRRHLLLRDELRLPMPARFLQGTADTEVPVAHAYRLFQHAQGPDLRLMLVKGADHRFSTPDCLALVEAQTTELVDRLKTRV